MNKNHQLIISIGTNVEHEISMAFAKRALNTLLPDIAYSSEVWSDPIKVGDEKFLNCLAIASTKHGAKQIVRAFKQIERKCGDAKGKRSKGIITVDIDLLKFDKEIYHEEDWQRDYVKTLSKELDDMKELLDADNAVNRINY